MAQGHATTLVQPSFPTSFHVLGLLAGQLFSTEIQEFRNWIYIFPLNETQFLRVKKLSANTTKNRLERDRESNESNHIRCHGSHPTPPITHFPENNDYDHRSDSVACYFRGVQFARLFFRHRRDNDDDDDDDANPPPIDDGEKKSF